jgi:hypothetical protein
MTATACLALCLTTLVNGRVQTDYYHAYREAQRSGKMLVIDFGTGFDFNTVDAKKLDGFVLCRVPVDYTIKTEGMQARLIDSPAFDCLQKQPGIVVVDLQEKTHFGETISVLPQRYSAAGYVDALFDLPVGSITQRTLTWAFRVHQERPACTQGVADPTLMQHADRQSTVQAQSNSMFHSSNFPGSFEIVAQSGSGGGNLADVAIELVNTWRGSAPHWGAATTAWSRYGVDMQSNGGSWYATGVFQ